ncbi:MAG: glycosyltransferase family 9 protein [Armatimonadota bacterium]|jgi:lipopolysaccharide heptosyltransferase I
MAERVLIVRMSAMGDLIQTTPLPRAIKAARPDAHITWLAQTPFASLLEHNPHLDEIIPVPHRNLTPGDLLEAWWRIKAGQFTVAIDPQGLLKSACATWMTGAPWRIGKEEAREVADFAYNHIIPERWDQTYISQRYLELCEPLGASRDDYVPEISLADDDFGPVDELYAAENLDGSRPVVAIAPFTAEERKNWPADYWVRLGDLLVEQLDAQIIIPGSAAERERAEALAARMKRPAIAFAGKTTMREAAAFLQRIDLFVGGESGLAHMAFAVGTALACIVGPTPVRNGPKGPNARTVFAEGIECRPCRDRRCENPRCLTDVTPEMVLPEALAAYEA